MVGPMKTEFETYSQAYADTTKRRVQLSCKDWADIYPLIVSGEVSKNDFLWLLDNYREECNQFAGLTEID